jgi:zinc transporter ZupT
MEFLTQPYMMAFWFGAFTAVSLPLGAMLGIWLRPSSKIVAALMAFGAGNLLSALTLELIEPSFIHTGFWPISIGCVLGGTVFVLLNQLLDKMGGYMRKASTLVSHIKAKKRSEMQDMIEKLSQVDILRSHRRSHYVEMGVVDRIGLLRRGGDDAERLRVNHLVTSVRGLADLAHPHASVHACDAHPASGGYRFLRAVFRQRRRGRVHL